MSCDADIDVDRVVTSTVMRLVVIIEAWSRLKNSRDFRKAYEAYLLIERNTYDIAETLRTLRIKCWEIVKTKNVLEAEASEEVVQ